jgi:DNA-binding NtrC family response regulator
MVLVLECRRLLDPGCRLTLEPGDELSVGRGAMSRLERDRNTITLQVADFQASRRHFVVHQVAGAWQIEDRGSRNGTFVNGERVSSVALADGDVIEAGGTMLVFVEDAGDAPDRLLGEPAGMPFRTLSVELDVRLRRLAKIAPSLVPVLVRGETGTGKEVIARAVHEASGRRGAFVAVNCGALPRTLIESELFGHKRGSFSGANEDREGLVRRAHGGTLFLDEIAELPMDSQVALLRVLQEGEVRPVGASEDVRVDVRIVAATHQDLRTRILTGQFREDLYGRIAGFEVTMPPLRERREDLGMLIAALLPRIAEQPERITLSHGAARALMSYRWPLNVRELEQTLRAAIALGDGGGEIRAEHLPPQIRVPQLHEPRALRPEDLVLRERVVQLLREHEGNVAAVGRAMARAPIQIRRWCTRLQIDLAEFRH